MTTRRKLYLGADGNLEFIFDADGTLLHLWHCQDGAFEADTLQPMWNKLGFHMEWAPDWMMKNAEPAADKWWEDMSDDLD